MSEAVEERTALPTVFEWQAQQVEHAAKNVAHWVATTPEDKLSWIPKAEGQESEARSIYDMVNECSQINRRFANMLRGLENGPFQPEPSYTSSAEAQADLLASADEAAAVVRGLDESVLTSDFPTSRGSMKGSYILTLMVANMQYHGGQINLIQMLLGDGEFHLPG